MYKHARIGLVFRMGRKCTKPWNLCALLIMTYEHKQKPLLTRLQTHTQRKYVVESVVRFAMTELRLETLKDKQEAIISFVNGRDCFVILPTGYGKTPCYVLLPYVFYHLRGKTMSSIVICASPLISLMMDQVKKYSVLGLAMQFVGQAQEDLL